MIWQWVREKYMEFSDALDDLILDGYRKDPEPAPDDSLYSMESALRVCGYHPVKSLPSSYFSSLKKAPTCSDCQRPAAYLIGEHPYCDDHSEIMGLPIALLLSEDLSEIQKTFDQRWDADMRAISRWENKHPNQEKWPDHEDLVLFLMEELRS